MKFYLILALVCLGYYFLFKPEPEQPKAKIELSNQSPDGIVKANKPASKVPEIAPEIRKSVWEVTFFGMTLHAGTWLVVVVTFLSGGKIFRV